MCEVVLALCDRARGRLLPTTVRLPDDGQRAPLIVFAHGFWGHPRKFERLFDHFTRAGYVVAAPAFPHTNDAEPPPYLIEDVVNQPADVSFVLDELLAREIGDPARVGVGGFSLGAETALAVGLHPGYADPRLRAVLAIAGGLFHPAFTTDVLRPVPLLLIHGAEDRSVEPAAARLVFETATGPKQFILLQGATHDICQDSAAESRIDRVAELAIAFYDRQLRDA